MLRLNIFIFVLFSLSGAMAYEANFASHTFKTWSALYKFVPYAIFSGVVLLVVSTFSVPYKSWGVFNLRKFLFNPNEPHIFIASAASIFFAGGMLGIIMSLINGLPVNIFSGMLVLFGLAYAVPAIIVCIWLRFKINA